MTESQVNAPPHAMNELGGEMMYKEVSYTAVVSFGAGLLSFLAFAPSWAFMIIPCFAIVTGLIAGIRIASAPEVYSGRWMARLGICLAVIFGVSAGSDRFLREFMATRHAETVGDRFVGLLSEGDLESAYWLCIPKPIRDQFIKGKVKEVDRMKYYKMYTGRFLRKFEDAKEIMVSGEFKKNERKPITYSGTRDEYDAVVEYTLSDGLNEGKLILMIKGELIGMTDRKRYWFVDDYTFIYN